MPARSQSAGRSAQVVLTAGPAQAARAVLGLQAALAAAASGISTSVFLTLDATAWACEPRSVPGGEAVYELLDQLTSFRVEITCCSACAVDLCGFGQRDSRAAGGGIATHETVVLVGLATLMERVASGVPTITF